MKLKRLLLLIPLLFFLVAGSYTANNYFYKPDSTDSFSLRGTWMTSFDNCDTVIKGLVDMKVPTIVGQTDKFLTNNGSSMSWATVPAIDSVATHFLDGTGTFRALASTDIPILGPVYGSMTTGAANVYPSSDGTATGTKVQHFFVTLTGTGTFYSPAGTWSDGDKLVICVYSAGAQTLNFTTSAVYDAIGVTLPTSNGAGKYTYVGCIYRGGSVNHWHVVAVTNS